MNSSSNDLLVLSITFVITVLFYIPLLSIFLQRRRQKNTLNQFYRAILSILERNDNLQDCINQINMVYRKTSEKNTYISNNFRGIADILEDLIYRVESYSTSKFKQFSELEFTDTEKNKIIDIIAIIKTNQPFTSLNSKHGNMLNLLKTSIESNNDALGKTTLEQLSDEIAILESTIRNQETKNRISLIVSIIGTVLTLVFGAITIINFI